MKPNSEPLYVHVESNHLPKIIERIPKMIGGRISGIFLFIFLFIYKDKVYK